MLATPPYFCGFWGCFTEGYQCFTVGLTVGDPIGGPRSTRQKKPPTAWDTDEGYEAGGKLGCIVGIPRRAYSPIVEFRSAFVNTPDPLIFFILPGA
mgnify:FL=1